MKCDELKAYGMADPAIGDEYEMYKVTEVDAAIEELKAKLESAQASAYADSVDAGMRERRLRRALYKACANWAKSELRRRYGGYPHESNVWFKMKTKCRAMVEKFK